MYDVTRLEIWMAEPGASFVTDIFAMTMQGPLSEFNFHGVGNGRPGIAALHRQRISCLKWAHTRRHALKFKMAGVCPLGN